MNIYAAAIVAVIISYLLGSVPSAFIIGRLFKNIDIRKTGSGNMGAMNVIYSVGIVPGLLVGALDVGKGALAVYLSTQLCMPANPPALILMIVQMICGLASIAGHNYPAFLGFRRGGRGGATAIGVLFYMIPLGIFFYILLILIVLAITRYLTISYAAAFLAFPIVVWLQWATPIDSWIEATLPFLSWTRSRAADPFQCVLLAVYSIVLIVIPLLMYIPRIKEIMSKSGGSFKKAAFHHSVKERP